MVGRPVLLVLGLAGPLSPALALTPPAGSVATAPRSHDLDRAGAGSTLDSGGSAASPIAALFERGTMSRASRSPIELAAVEGPWTAPVLPGVLAGGVAPLPSEFAASPARSAERSANQAAAVTVVSVLPPPRPDPALAAAGIPSPPRAGAGAVPVVAVLAIATLPPARPSFDLDAEPTQTASISEPSGTRPFSDLFTAPLPSVAEVPSLPAGGHGGLDDRIAYHARLNEVPADLVHRVVVRESKYDPRAVGRGGALGLMQIKHATARALGYGGTAKGLLDAETNLTYAVKYLAGAYRTASGNYDRAVAYYARGYYYAAKRLAADGMGSVVRGRPSRPDVLAAAAYVETGRTVDVR